VNRPYTILPETSGRTIQAISVHDDPPTREILIEFTDGSSVAIDLASTISIHARHYRETQGDLETLQEVKV
jgi:hypothetical protein